MVNLFASLDVAAGALRAFQQGLTVSQNNVSNATTAGYAKQDIALEALSFQPLAGLAGGVRSGAIQNSRDRFAEQAVRQQLSTFSNFAQRSSVLSRIEGLFDITGEAGISASLNRLFDSFSAFSSSPNSTVSRQEVLDAAQGAALSFNRAANEIAGIASEIDANLKETVDRINQVAGQVRAYNAEVLRSGSPDAGLEAVAFASAEALAELVDISILAESNGTMTVLMGGQVPLVIGAQQQEVMLEFFTPANPLNLGAPPSARILDASGRDVTATISRGQLGGLLYAHETVLPSLAGDATQEGSLNRLAKAFADRVNEILTNGLVATGPPPIVGVPLFAYDSVNTANAARTLMLDPGISPDQLAAIAPGPPLVSNGTALDLAELRSSRRPTDTIDGLTFLEFYGSLAREIGDGVKTTRQEEARANLLVTRARDLRSQVSGVSLDEEAVKITEFQRAFEANAQVIRVVDELLESVLSLLR